VGAINHCLKIRAGLSHWIGVALHGLIGQKQANGRADAAKCNAPLAPCFLADVKLRFQAVCRFNDVVPVDRPWLNWDVVLESFAGGVKRLFDGDVLEAGGEN
jgi:hypothetical protein